MENKQDTECNTYNIEQLWGVIEQWDEKEQLVFTKYIAGYSIEEIVASEDLVVDEALGFIERCKERLAMQR